jgi:glutamate formiminotransferase / 5-formyltetrahydrofolate cyclo-ligase
VPLLESVPNVSEGRDPRIIAAIGQSFAEHGRVLDVHSDVDHHRSVFTIVADEDELVDSLLAGIARSAELVDLRSHDGIHPRVGATDVVPIVPLRNGEMALASEVALTVGRRVGEEIGLPVFLYGENGRGRRPAFFRRGGPDELQSRIDSGELKPTFGPSRLDPRAGAVLIGSRPLLIAFNIELETGDLVDAQAIAAAIRESSGGMEGVQALGLLLPRSGRVQVSVNVIDVEAAPLVAVVERVREVAAARAVELGPSELVGLLPESSVVEPTLLGLEALPDDRVLERRLLAS